MFQFVRFIKSLISLLGRGSVVGKIANQLHRVGRRRLQTDVRLQTAILSKSVPHLQKEGSHF